MASECKKTDCRFYFTDDEEHYICCPYCGTLREDKLPSDPIKARIVRKRHKKFDDFSNLAYKSVIVFMGVVFFVAIIMSFTHRCDFLGWTCKNIASSARWGPAMVIVIFGAIEILFPIFKKHTNITWMCDTFISKTLKWFVFAIYLSSAYQDSIQYIIDWYTKRLAQSLTDATMQHLIHVINMKFLIASFLLSGFIALDVMLFLQTKRVKEISK